LTGGFAEDGVAAWPKQIDEPPTQNPIDRATPTMSLAVNRPGTVVTPVLSCLALDARVLAVEVFGGSISGTTQPKQLVILS
jgi:hypothetical protein